MGTLDGRLYSNVVWRFTLDPHLSQDRQPDPFTVDPQASQDRQQGPQQEEQAEDSPAEAPELPYNRCQCWAHNLHQSALNLMTFTVKGPEPLWYPLPVPTLSLSTILLPHGCSTCQSFQGVAFQTVIKCKPIQHPRRAFYVQNFLCMVSGPVLQSCQAVWHGKVRAQHLFCCAKCVGHASQKADMQLCVELCAGSPRATASC